MEEEEEEEEEGEKLRLFSLPLLGQALELSSSVFPLSGGGYLYSSNAALLNNTHLCWPGVEATRKIFPTQHCVLVPGHACVCVACIRVRRVLQLSFLRLCSLRYCTYIPRSIPFRQTMYVYFAHLY